ncbi:MAG: hypothetical protein ACLFQB_07480 [Chitinispirillaceae bacterium]
MYARPDTASDRLAQLKKNKRIVAGEFIGADSFLSSADLECSTLMHKWARVTFSKNDKKISGFCRAGHLRFPSFSIVFEGKKSNPVRYLELNGYGKNRAYDCYKDIPEWTLPDSKGTFFNRKDLSSLLIESCCSDGKFIIRDAQLETVCQKLGIKTRKASDEKIRFDPPLPCFFISDDTSGTAACSLMQTYRTDHMGQMYQTDSIVELVDLPVEPKTVILGLPKKITHSGVQASVLEKWTGESENSDRSSLCQSIDFDGDKKADLVLFELNGINQMHERPYRYREAVVCVKNKWYAVSFVHCLGGLIEPSTF